MQSKQREIRDQICRRCRCQWQFQRRVPERPPANQRRAQTRLFHAAPQRSQRALPGQEWPHQPLQQTDPQIEGHLRRFREVVLRLGDVRLRHLLTTLQGPLAQGPLAQSPQVLIPTLPLTAQA